MSEIDRAKVWRGGQRGVVTKYIQEVKALVDAESIEPGSRRHLNMLSKLLEEKKDVLKALDNEIVATCPTEEIERDVQEAEEVYEKIVESLAAIDHVKESTALGKDVGPSDSEHSSSRESSVSRDESIVRTNTSKMGAPVVSRSGSHDELNTTARSDETIFAVKPKLPKITLPRFSGKVTKFRVFWDSFESTVDKNPSLSTVDKFNYLNALLKGSAARSTQGLSLSEANYTTVTEILKERFGRIQAIILVHMESPLQLPVCAGDRSSHLRLVYDKIKVNVRGLETLGVRAEQYGSFLIPIIMAKLPSEVRLQIARVTNKDVWEVEELLQVIKAEVEAREISDTIKVHEVRHSDILRRNV